MRKKQLLHFKKLLPPLVVFIVAILVVIQDKKDTSSESKSVSTPSRDKESRDEPASFDAFHRAIRIRAGEKAPRYRQNYISQEFQLALERRQNMVRLRGEHLPWIERGPGNVSGRTRGLLVDPDDTTHMTWYAGSVGGGVWKTENSGQTWRHLTEELPNLANSTLAMSPANSDIIYLGTG